MTTLSIVPVNSVRLRVRAVSVGLLFVAFSLAAGCVTGSQIRKRADDVQTLMGDQRESMYNCAPVELAQAETFAEIARHESSMGRSIAADKAMKEAERTAELAYQNSREAKCLNDADADNIPDRKDRCPNQAEDIDEFEDADGCPDPDNDADGTLDESDLCRSEAGPTYNKGCPVVDTDGDGLSDLEDNCPKESGPVGNRGCPIIDTDNDGVQDSQDRCPYQQGLLSNQGCPMTDTDGDTVPDQEDKCPAEAGPVSNRGCPWGDTDGDGLLDPDDKCPMDPGPRENLGCEYKRIQITEKKIELREKVFFKSGKAEIKRESWALLDEVAQAMIDHPEIRVDIEGHTDDVGNDKSNLRLSQARADAVKKYLIGRGVEGARMRAIGYGEDRPIDDNSTPEGQAINRRVEFVITSR